MFPRAGPSSPIARALDRAVEVRDRVRKELENFNPVAFPKLSLVSVDDKVRKTTGMT